MQVEIITNQNIKLVHIKSDKIVISDLQSAIDLMMNVKYETGIKNIIIPKNLITDKFFILSSELAGVILQKFINYQFRIAIYGDFARYTSKPLKDFIYESNHGHDVFFVDSLDTAVEKIITNKGS